MRDETEPDVAAGGGMVAKENTKAAEAAEIKALLNGRSAVEITVTGLCQVFWDLEERYDLVKWQVNGVHPWPLVRMSLYYSLTRKLGLFENAHPAIRAQFEGPSLVRRMAFLAWFVSSKFRPAPAPRGQWHPAALMMSTRRVGGSEPYTDAVRAELGRDALLLDRPHAKADLRGAFDIDTVRWAFRLLYRKKAIRGFPQDARALCHRLRCDLIERLGVDPGDLAKQCSKVVSNFQPLRDGARDMFQRRGIRTLFITYGYGPNNQALIEGARLAGARVVELQHGFISKYHLGYSWPGQEFVPHMPDELWCFGRYWAETTPLPSSVQTRVIGAPYIARMAAENQQERDPKQVVFNSQGVIGKLLFDIAVETARRRPDLKVIFRLHPSEALDVYETRLVGVGSVPSNFSLSHRTPNIFALQAATGIQVGAFSTTLFEGMALGTRTVAIDLPGIEYMTPAFERGDAILVRDVDELIARIEEAPLAKDPELYYAKPLQRLLDGQ